MTTATETKVRIDAAIPETALRMLDEGNATHLRHELFHDMYEVVNGDRRVVVILDECCVRWIGYAKGWGLCKLRKREAKPWMRDGEWTPVNGRHEFGNTDRNRITCVRNAIRWANA